MQLIARTEIEWKYSPSDFFEADFSPAVEGYVLSIVAGSALAKFEGSKITRFQVAKDIEIVFRIRKMQTRKDFQIRQVDFRQYDENNLAHRTMFCETGDFVVVGESIDIILRDTSGNIVRDTKAERIKGDTDFINSTLSKSQKSPLLQTLIEYYSASIDDPANEMVHLYDVRDALCQEFGSKKTTITALKLDEKKEWNRLGKLACDEPINQSRHRGKHFKQVRAASPDELDEARKIVVAMIKSYVDCGEINTRDNPCCKRRRSREE